MKPIKLKIGECVWQGDVGLRRIAKLPDNLTPKDSILAYGEKTGHKHQFMQPQTEVLVQKGKDNTQFVNVIADAGQLVHDEHDQVKLAQDYYEVMVQREHDIVEGTRQVMD